MKNIIYQTNNFIVYVPNKPHISREDGGHIVITSVNENYESRLDLSQKEAIELIRLTMLISDAMIIAMKDRNINIDRINYQENGNWAFLRNEKPKFHIHLYGRTKNSKSQKWGEALNFPNPIQNTDFYDDFESLNDDDVNEIKKQISILEQEEKYNINNWIL
jgi:diadenosine tetraphosphate (Ap4A) HIT family hydrolase